MKRFWTTSLALAAGFLPLGAYAACQERGDLVCGGGAPSIASEGGLQVSRGGSFSPLAAGRTLRPGDRILSGEGAATLSLGPTCSAAVAPGSLVSLSRSGGRTCARISRVEVTPPGSQAAEPVLSDPALGGLGIAAGAAGVTGIALAVSGGRNTPTTVSAQ